MRVLIIPNVSIVLSPPLSSGSALRGKTTEHGRKAVLPEGLMSSSGAGATFA